MKYVVDINKSRDAELESILVKGNDIIITSDFFIESFNSEIPVNIIERNIKIIEKYPDQIFSTYDRGELFNKELSIGMPLQSNDIMSDENTNFIRSVLTQNGSDFNRTILQFKAIAESRIIYQNNFADQFIRKISNEAYQILADSNEINVYRKDSDKKFNDMRDFSFKLLEYVLKKKCTTNYDLHNFKLYPSIIFSLSFILIWRVVDWVIKGGFENAKKKLLHDSFDINYVLMSCFFDGILSDEKWMVICRDETLKNFNI